MASTADLVPITRAFLAKFYDKYQFDPLVPEVTGSATRVKTVIDELLVSLKKSEGSEAEAVESVLFSPPHKIDENLWKNREQIEETLRLLDKALLPETVAARGSPMVAAVAEVIDRIVPVLQDVLKVIEEYQAATSTKVKTMVFTYLPQDLRGTLLKMQMDLGERSRAAAVTALVQSGGTIKDRYALLWKQQVDRREKLAGLGSASGMYKAFVKYLVGVPQVLLDFVKTINDHDGPLEEQRHRYGPPLYDLTVLINSIHALLVLWWRLFDLQITDCTEYSQLLEQAASVYASEMKRFLAFLGEVFANSPFLISAAEADANIGAEQFKEINILAGKNFELDLGIEVEGSMVAWDFSLTYGKDVGFSVEFLDKDGHKMSMLPYKRYQSHQGHFYATGAGAYKLTWDNSYSLLYQKTVKYKVEAVPPVTPSAGTGAPLTAEDFKAEDAVFVAAEAEHIVESTGTDDETEGKDAPK
eukprot:TRINITY_DN17044_c0_g1_i2.p1 TRINITY_DN17044_c0_g1~~TRINITY_DN17044_c0_g1_i2.p1  ORF type:complete len:472 (-),score=113.20 TRINITY_DN17044_c0_g1_i2:1077-2492(-)